jgi:hypothetical protein
MSYMQLLIYTLILFTIFTLTITVQQENSVPTAGESLSQPIVDSSTSISISFVNAPSVIGPCDGIILTTILSRPVDKVVYSWTLLNSTAPYHQDLERYMEMLTINQVNDVAYVPFQLVDAGNSYTIQVEVISPFGKATTAITFTKQPYTDVYLQLRSPVVTKHNSQRVFTQRFIANSTGTQCLEVDSQKHWTIYQDGQLVVDTTGARGLISLPPRSLTAGGTFEFMVAMKMHNYELLHDSLTFSVFVDKPVAFINASQLSGIMLYDHVVFSGAYSYDPEGSDATQEVFEWSCDNCEVEQGAGREAKILFTRLGENTVTLVYIPYKDYPERNTTTVTTVVVSVLNPMSVAFEKVPSTVIAPCDGIILNVTSSRRLFSPFYTWKLVKSTTSYSADLVAFLDAISSTGAFNYLEIPSDIIPNGNNFTIRMNVTEEYYWSSTEISISKQVYTDVQPRMIITQAGSALRQEGVNQLLNSKYDYRMSIRASSTSQSCISNDVHVEISLYSSTGELLVFGAQSGYYVRSSTLLVGGTFQFLAVIKHSAVPSLDFRYNVSIVVQKPVLSIMGGDRAVKRGEQFMMRPSLSYDPEQTTSVYELFEWTCIGCTISNSSSATTNFTISGTVGHYPVSLLYIPDTRYPARNVTSTVIVTAVSDNVPLIHMSTVIGSVINSQKSIKIDAGVVDVDSMLKKLITFRWTVLSGGTVVKQLPSTSILQPLILAENELNEGQDYEFKVSARYTAASDVAQNYATSSLYARTATTPILESFAVTPTSGYALDTNFQMTCSGLSKDSDPLVTYRFEMFDKSLNAYSLLRGSSSQTQYTTLLPQSDQPILVRCVVLNSFGYQTASKTISVTVTKAPVLNVKDTVDKIENIVQNNKTNDIAVAQSVTDLTQELQKSGNTEELKRVQQIVDTMLTQISNQSITTTSTSDDVEKKASILETLSRSGGAISSTAGVQTAFSIVTKILTITPSAETGTTILSTNAINSAAQFVANMITNKPSDPTIAQATVNTIDMLRQAAMGSISVSQDQTVISTSAFDLAVKLEYGNNLQNSSVTSGNNSVFIPEIQSLSSDKQYSYELTVFKNGINPYQYGNLSTTSSSILNFKLLSGNDKVPLVELQQPLEIVFNIQNSILSNQTNLYKQACMYWDGGNEWGTYGCWVHELTETQITCRCNHTTSFASFIIYDPSNPNKATPALYVVSIVFNVGFALSSIVLLILCFAFRNDQPLRSRHVVPFIGLTAVLFEAIMQGIIRNSLLLAAKEASDYRPINNLSHVLMVVVNPLVLLSLFVFLIQQIRYFFMNNLYSLMDAEGSNTKVIRVYRMLTSKVLFAGLACLIWVAATAYYLIFAILSASGVLSATATTSVNSIGYSVMSFTLAVFIVIAFTWDAIVVTSTKIKTALKKKEELSEGTVEVQIVKKVFTSISNHFGRDDPLKFRWESVFMTIAMLCLIVSYALGLADRYNEDSSPKSPVKIIQTIFDWIYIAFRIASFGGFTVISYFISKDRQRASYDLLKQSSADEEATDILEKMLLDSKGYELIKEYSRMEYSVENCFFYEILTKLRSENLVMNPAERKANIQILIEKFVTKGAELEVNMSNRTKKMLQELDAAPTIAADQFETVLLALYGEVMKNLSDTFIRFSGTAEYANYQGFKQMHLELLSVAALDTREEVVRS